MSCVPALRQSAMSSRLQVGSPAGGPGGTLPGGTLLRGTPGWDPPAAAQGGGFSGLDSTRRRLSPRLNCALHVHRGGESPGQHQARSSQPEGQLSGQASPSAPRHHPAEVRPHQAGRLATAPQPGLAHVPRLPSPPRASGSCVCSTSGLLAKTHVGCSTVPCLAWVWKIWRPKGGAR